MSTTNNNSTYADPEEVRRLAGGRGEETLPTEKLTKVIERSDARVRLWSKKYDWDETHPDYKTVQAISELLASASVRKSFDDKDDEADEQEKQATEYMQHLLESPHLTEDDKQNVLIESRPYGSFPANPNGVLYSRGRFIRIRGTSGADHYDADLDAEGVREINER